MKVLLVVRHTELHKLNCGCTSPSLTSYDLDTEMANYNKEYNRLVERHQGQTIEVYHLVGKEVSVHHKYVSELL